MNLKTAYIFAALTLSTSFLPASALPGRLGAHSLGTVKHWQDSRVKAHHHHSLSRVFHLRRLARLHRSKTTTASHSYMWWAPEADADVRDDEKDQVISAFLSGAAQNYSPASLIASDVFKSCPMHGGVFKRKSAVKYIILHSTETERVADAQRVIRSWSNRGLIHPGAQFVVDRDGTIYCTADPAYGTTHVDTRRTRFGVNNDNSVGIEMVRAGEQSYTDEQMHSISCLVSYLQRRYAVDDEHIFGHGMVQPSDRRDPVDFNWQAFAAEKNSLRGTAFSAPERKPQINQPDAEQEGPSD
jgi:hypothetical protein